MRSRSAGWPELAPPSTSGRLDAIVYGRVQGVGFRMHVRRIARNLGLGGWVANEPADRLRCVAEGPHDDLRTLLEALRRGPPGAHVERVEESWPPATGEFTQFEVRSGWHSGD
jgi:acylphosphatase